MNLLELKSNPDFPSDKLGDNTIHLWIAQDSQIRCEVSMDQCFTIISDTEQETRQRLHFDDHKHQYVITRTLVRDVLSRYRPEIAPEDWIFEKNEFGRPQISREQCNDDLYFNISHTSGFVVLAMANHYQVGIDVERFNEKIEFRSIAERFFAPDEFDAMSSLEKKMQYRRFYDLWTLKESFVKAKGMGLSFPFNCFSFRFDIFNNVSLSIDRSENTDARMWRFWRQELDSCCKIALCFESRIASNESLEIEGFHWIPYEKNFLPFGMFSEMV